MKVNGQTQRPVHSSPGKRPGTHCTGGWVVTQGRWGRARKISPPLWFDPRTLQPVAISYRKRLEENVPCTVGRPYTEGTGLYCDYSIWCVSCTVVVWTSFVMCGWFDNCVCFGNMCTCIYCVLHCLYRVFFGIVSFMYIYSYLFCLY